MMKVQHWRGVTVVLHRKAPPNGDLRFAVRMKGLSFDLNHTNKV